MILCPHCGQPMPEVETKPPFSTGPVIAAGFGLFWEEYPHKVGKAAAAKAFGIALKKARFPDILDGLKHYKVVKPLSTPWCNPATWLNQERWLDQPAYVDTAQKPEPPKQDGFEIWRVRIRNYLKDGSWPQIAPPLEQCPGKIYEEFAEQLKAVANRV